MKNSLIFVLLCLVVSASSVAKDLAPPQQILTDKFGINLVTGEVTTAVDTVSIGGGLGLSHSAATHDSGFVTDHNGLYRLSGVPSTGFYETYDGNAIYDNFAQPLQKTIVIDGVTIQSQTVVNAMKVFDKDGAENFLVKVNGVIQPLVSCSPNCPPMSSVTFVSMKDKRNSLNWDGTDLIWQKASGAKSYFRVQNGLSPLSGGRFRIAKIEYPNGFTISINRWLNSQSISSVTTNTGYQLKYLYKKNLSGLDPEKASTSINAAMTAKSYLQGVPAIDSHTWSSRNPSEIVAINNSVDACSNVGTEVFNNSCSAIGFIVGGYFKWPRAIFNWPNGMPRALYIGDSIVSIIDASKRTTVFNIRAYNSSNLYYPAKPAFTPDESQQLPRLVSVKLSGTFSGETVSYQFNNGQVNGVAGLTNGGYANFASGINGAANLSIDQLSDQCGSFGASCSLRVNKSHSDGVQRVYVAKDVAWFGNIYKASTVDGTLIYDYAGVENWPIEYLPIRGPRQNFYYDSRGNLNRIVYGQGTALQTEANSFFPVNCSNPKTCNKPEWTSDAKGNKTYFTYHPQSGEVASIRSPAVRIDGQMIEPVIRYTYEQKYAYYYHDGAASKSQSETPVWLKTAEKTCLKTATNIDVGTCAGGTADEVVTRFEYNDNLQLKGVVVAARNSLGEAELRRTCYQYDIYSNRIAETKPNANMTACN